MSVPRHIGIILDGNRRFAKRLMMKPWKGHTWGKEKVMKLFDWMVPKGIKEITLYAFSLQNFHRPKEEFNYIMNLFSESCDELLTRAEEFRTKGIRITIIGRLHLLPETVREKVRAVMQATKDNKPYMCNFAIAYGGREEVLDAVTAIAQQVKEGELDITDINEKTFAENLYLPRDPELIIRTGGEHRTSNFLPWQSTYSEWFFLDKMWPEFEEADLVSVLDQYAHRERRFGR